MGIVERVDWSAGWWLNEPPVWKVADDRLIVNTALRSDLWRLTSYGFIHDTGHGLLNFFSDGQAIEVDLRSSFGEEFDQAGLLIWSDDENWLKCGLEFADGVLGLGAVVTRGSSDWSTGQVPEWSERVVTVRASRSGDAVTIRAKVDDEPFRLVRVAPIDSQATWHAGPYAASPSREALEVQFLGWRVSAADTSLH